jgi:hypothetical protein
MIKPPSVLRPWEVGLMALIKPAEEARQIEGLEIVTDKTGIEMNFRQRHQGLMRDIRIVLELGG